MDETQEYVKRLAGALICAWEDGWTIHHTNKIWGLTQEGYEAGHLDRLHFDKVREPVIREAQRTLRQAGIPYGQHDADKLRAETIARAELQRD